MKSYLSARRLAVAGLLLALSLLLGYVESLIPIAPGIPGVKLGLANLVVLLGLFFLPLSDTLLILISRIVLSSFLFGSLSGMLYSMAGGIFAFLAMVLLKKTRLFSMTGVSIAGGVAHNLAQLLTAMAVLQSPALLGYAPVLLLAGTIAGTVVGILAARCAPLLPSLKDQDLKD